jgi:glycosyltransferase involved in cell wall biosynthesis
MARRKGVQINGSPQEWRPKVSKVHHSDDPRLGMFRLPRESMADEQTMTKTVLMICYYFPPIVTSGVARSLEFAKLLPDFGWKPLVLTVKQSKDPWIAPNLGENLTGIRVERTLEWNLAGLADFLHGACRRIARLVGKNLDVNLFRRYLCFPDPQIAWFSTLPALRLARECDLIYVSCTPFSSAVSAALAKRLTGRPLVVDFRDMWSPDYQSDAPRLQRVLVPRFERFFLDTCDALIVNTDGAARLYAELYPEHRHKVVAIPNAYDALTPVEPVSAGGDFQIMHVGSFYGSRNPDELLECLAAMNRPDILFVQVGGSFASYERFKDRVRIRVLPPLPRKEAIELMHEASLLYLRQATSDHLAIAAKTYEYLATGLPVLAEVPPGDNADIVRNYASTAYLVTSGNRADLRKAVEKAYAARSRTRAAILPEFAEKFSRRTLTRQLSAVFDRVTGPARAGE